jgi:hypothetical protein
VNSGTRKAILAGAAVLLVAGAVVLWRLLVPHTIVIQITSIPDGASVTITAPNQPTFKHKCVTPNCSLGLAPGRYSLEIEHEGYLSSNQTIDVDGKGTHSFPVELAAVDRGETREGTNPHPPPPPKFATLQVRGLKAGSDLEVDGKSVGRVDQNGEKSVQVPPGKHRVKVLAKNENSITLVPTFGAGQLVSLGRDEFYPHTVLAPEDVDWQKMLESTPTVDSLEKFLQKYPSGTHRVEARDMLESSYWDKDSHANTAGSYREYIGHFPQGPHAAVAEEELAFLDAYNQKDPATLDAFVSKYGSSRHRAEIDGLRDEAAWQRTNRGDENSLDAYLNAFPRGSHSGEAKGKLADLRDDAVWQRTNRGDDKSLDAYLNAFPEGKHAKEAKGKLVELHKPPPPPPVDERRAVLGVIAEYQRAYNERNLEVLRNVWPGMPALFASNTGKFFRDARSITLTYNVIDGPHVDGDEATVTFSQVIDAGTKQGKGQSTARVTAKLRKTGLTQGTLAGWQIESLK